MKRYFWIVAAVAMAFILGIGLTSVIALAQEGEDGGDPWPSSGTTADEGDSTSPDQPGPVEEVVLAPDQGDDDLRIAGSVLKPRNSGVEWTNGGGGGCIYATAGSTSVWWNTPVYLPQGSVVKRVRMYTNDAHDGHNCRAFFTVYDLYGDIVEEWGVSSSGHGGDHYWTTGVFTHTVNYEMYSYVMNWQPNELGADMQLCGLRIYYDAPPTAVWLPIIKR